MKEIKISKKTKRLLKKLGKKARKRLDKIELPEKETGIEICLHCGTEDVELEQCEYCLGWFCIECIDEHKLNCPEREVL